MVSRNERSRTLMASCLSVLFVSMSALPCAAQICPEVSNVSCTPSLGIGTVAISWDTGGFGYTSVEIYRDGVYLADVTGLSFYNDSSHSGGVISYAIVAQCGFEGSIVGCAVDFSSWFRRGDVNDDGATNIADAVYLLGHLFAVGSPNAINCRDAADANDDAAINISDAVTILNSLFVQASQPLPPPYYDCGTDPTAADGIDCLIQQACPPPP
ncbi:MAG: hypothetical protein AAF581_09875 [Planctomycetota bacterium]